MSRLERCALCGEKPSVGVGTENVWCSDPNCAQGEEDYALPTSYWNRLNRAIRKARRPGKVLARVYANLEGDCMCRLGRGRQCTCRTADCRRVEVREAKGAGR